MKTKNIRSKAATANEDAITALAERLISNVRDDIYSDTWEVRQKVARIHRIADTLEKEIRHKRQAAEKEPAETTKRAAGTIKAEVHSDDHLLEVDFFADKWFEQAEDNEVLDLTGIDWGGDYPADVVAQYMEFHDVEVARLFLYLGFNPRMATGDTVGFECHIDKDSAMEWLKQNRPHLYELINNE